MSAGKARPTRREATVWRQMEALLTGRYGERRGAELLRQARATAADWLAATKETSPSRRRTMRDSIYPRVAVYAALRSAGLDADAALDDYVRDVAGPMMHGLYARLERLPFFYALYSRLFLAFTKRSDAWTCEGARGADGFTLTIRRCLWHDACREAGCPEACRFFCDCDNYTYGGLHRIGFTRTRTLGTGGDMCDFAFFRKRDRNG